MNDCSERIARAFGFVDSQLWTEYLDADGKSFHDFEVANLVLSADEVHGASMLLLLKSPLGSNSIVALLFEDVIGVRLSHFQHQNVVFELNIFRKLDEAGIEPIGWQVEVVPSFGCQVCLKCSQVWFIESVSYVEDTI